MHGSVNPRARIRKTIVEGNPIREVLMDDDIRAFRKSFCRATADSLRNIAGWLGVDVALGGGDYRRPSETQPADSDRLVAFHATAVVIEMASKLVSGAVAHLDDDRRLAASACIDSGAVEPCR
jgi:hypothetical protein